jgi:hypothetical protein
VEESPLIEERTNNALHAKIKELESGIGVTIEGLDSKLDAVLEKNEKDFLTAYRFHMLKV